MSVDLSPFVLCRCAILEFKSGQEAASCVEGNKDVEVGDHKIRLSHCYPMPDHGQSRHSLGLIGGRGATPCPITVSQDTAWGGGLPHADHGQSQHSPIMVRAQPRFDFGKGGM